MFSGEVFQFTFTGTEPPGFYSLFGILTFLDQAPLPLDTDHLEQTITFDGTVFQFLP